MIELPPASAGGVQSAKVDGQGDLSPGRYIDPFNTTGPTPIAGGDNISVSPGRSIMLAVTFGLSPKR